MNFEQYVNEASIDKVSKDFQFKKEKDALEVAEILGFEDVHKHKNVWMPGKDHEEFVKFAKKNLL